MKEYFNPTTLSKLESEIQRLNNEVWKLRYSDTLKATEISLNAIKLANQADNILLIMQTRLHYMICKFISSNEIEKIEIELNALNNYFIDSPDLRSRAIIYDYFARLNDSYGFYEKAIEYAKSAIKICTINKIPDIEHEVLTTLASIYRRLKKYDDALNLYKSALTIRENIQDEKAAASSHNLIARTYTENNDLIKSYEYYQKALVLRTKISDPAICFTYIGLASNYEIQENFQLAEQMYLKGIQSNLEFSNDKMSNYLCYYGLGNIYLKTKDFKKADDYLHKALHLANETHVKPNISKTHRALSHLFEQNNNHSKAFDHYKMYHKISEEIANSQIYQLKNIELKHKFQELEHKNQEIIESIEYSKRIQSAILPTDDFIESLLPEYFILYKPRSIVSGDFYWINKFRDKIIIVAADCTGHGVPGALMSMLGVAFLNEIISKSKKLQSNVILNKLREKIKKALRQEGNTEDQQDGMELVICILDTSDDTLQFSGARNAIYIIRDNELTEYKGDKMPIGIYYVEDEFTSKIIELKKGDMLYMSSDGYIDQFGGESGKKFLSRNFKELLLNINKFELAKQKEILNDTIEKWKAHLNSMGEPYEQTDDIMVIGIKI